MSLGDEGVRLHLTFYREAGRCFSAKRVRPTTDLRGLHRHIRRIFDDSIVWQPVDQTRARETGLLCRSIFRIDDQSHEQILESNDTRERNILQTLL
jgi:hypothetical protein